MTTPDDRDERREQQRADVQRLVGAVRAASGPGPDAGAARRIADGAWARAGMGAQAPGRRSRPKTLRLGHLTRRWALDQMNTAMLAFVSEVRIGREGGGTNAVWIGVGAPAGRGAASLEARAYAAGQTLTEISVTHDDKSVRIVVDGTGGVQVERDGVVHEYPTLDAVGAADPEALELLSPYLNR